MRATSHGWAIKETLRVGGGPLQKERGTQMSIALPVWLAAGAVGFAIGVIAGGGGMLGAVIVLMRATTSRPAPTKGAAASGNGKKPQ